MVKCWSGTIVVGVDQDKLSPFRADFVVPKAIGFIDPMGRDVSYVNRFAEIAGKEPLRSLIILDSTLRATLQRGKQEEANRPAAQIKNHLSSWYANTLNPDAGSRLRRYFDLIRMSTTPCAGTYALYFSLKVPRSFFNQRSRMLASPGIPI